MACTASVKRHSKSGKQCNQYYAVAKGIRIKCATACVSKARAWPRGQQMLGPRAGQNLQMPTRGTDKAGKCPAVAGGGGLGAAGIDLTRTLSFKLFSAWSSRSMQQTVNMSQTKDCDRNLCSIMLIGNQMVYS